MHAEGRRMVVASQCVLDLSLLVPAGSGARNHETVAAIFGLLACVTGRSGEGRQVGGLPCSVKRQITWETP
jgi:hypothetical protein